MGWSAVESGVDLAGRARRLAELAAARAHSDAVFARLPPTSFFERPIAERHRLIFYLGHVDAFDANLLRGLIELPPVDAGHDELFARGIDPIGSELPSDQPGDWPSVDQVRAYGRRCRAAVDAALSENRTWSHRHNRSGFAVDALIEHRLMHVETLAYALHQLPLDRLRPALAPDVSDGAAPPAITVAIPAGRATLGRRSGFGWDNEFDEIVVDVPGFAIDAYPVSNAAFLAFVLAGGYQERSLWSDAGWAWRAAADMHHPRLWRRRGDRWFARAVAAEIPLPLDHPVYVSHAEASAFVRWRGARLPTEAEWHRAAYGVPDLGVGTERPYPWGDDAPDASRGNLDLRRDDATPVGAHPAGASAWGVHDLVGNGWEWTSTIFAPLPGFEPFPFYPGYSADFFDGRHFVLKGGSARTAARFARRSFRNWFQPHYPYVYATFRCVEE